MNFTFVKINELKHKGLNTYYKKPFEGLMQPAEEFNDKYRYFYNDEQLNGVKPLGKFVGMSKRSSGSYSYDCDFDVFEFENNEIVFCNKKQYIFCVENQYYNENMTLIEDTLYNNYPVYYQHS